MPSESGLTSGGKPGRYHRAAKTAIPAETTPVGRAGREWGDGVRQLRDLLVTAVVLAVLGVAAGFTWSAIAPRTRYLGGNDGPQLADPTTQTLIAADGWFVLVTGVAGLACGIAAFLFARRVGVLAGLGAGGVLAGYAALQVGMVVQAGVPIGRTVRASAKGSVTEISRLDVTAHGVLMTWAFVAVACFGLLECIAGAVPYLPQHGLGRRGAMARAAAAGRPGRWPLPRHGQPRAPLRPPKAGRRSAHRREGPGP
jgi:hypothetical protein